MHIIEYKDFEDKSIFFMNNPSKIYSIFVFIQIILIFSIIIWVSCFEMDDTVKISALLRPVENISSVYAMPGGEVTNILYTNNQLVKEGELLLQIDTTADVEEMKLSKERMIEIDDDLEIFSVLIQSIVEDKYPENFEKEEKYSRLLNFYLENKRLLSSVDEAKVIYEREAKKPNSLKILQQIQDTKRRYDQTVLQYNTWKTTQEIQTKEYIKQLNIEKKNLIRRINDLNRNIKNSNLVAPITGRINEIRKMNIGDVILTGERLFDIVPIESNELKADVYVDSNYIAQIKEGQSIKLNFPGLPTVRYGQLTGSIKTIPPDCTVNNKGEVSFILTASLDANFLQDKNGKKVYMHSGMPAQGRIIIEKQKVIYMIFKKLGFINQ